MAQLNNTPETELTSLAERHKSILDILQLQGSVSVSDLAERLEVSEVTIRKDLSALEKQNKLPHPWSHHSYQPVYRRPSYQ